MKQFLSRNIHVTTARTGVLLFVSLAERYAEIVADSGINATCRRTTLGRRRHDPDRACKDRTASPMASSRRSARSAHFWRGIFRAAADDANELDDHVVEI